MTRSSNCWQNFISDFFLAAAIIIDLCLKIDFYAADLFLVAAIINTSHLKCPV